MMWVMSNLLLIRLEMVFESVHDTCMVCGKHTMALKSFWMHQMVLLGDVGPVESQFRAFRDSVSVGAR